MLSAPGGRAELPGCDWEAEAGTTATARLTGTGALFKNSSTTARPLASRTAAVRWTTSPPGTRIAVDVTGMPSMR